MKRFLYRDHSGRNFTADWNEHEIRRACKVGGAFEDFAADDDEGDVEGLLSWVDRCSAGDEYDLDAADIVCIDENVPRFSIAKTSSASRLVIVDEHGQQVATLTRDFFGSTLNGTSAAANETWAALVDHLPIAPARRGR